jgi:magnesium chelatase subunit I
MNALMAVPQATNLKALLETGWTSRTVKREMRDNLMRMLASGEQLFPGIVGYEDTVIPEINLAMLAEHDILFLGEKGQAKSRLMRLLTRFLDEWTPYIDHPELPVHEDPLKPISRVGKELVAQLAPEDLKIAWWHRSERYAERLSPGTKFADIIGEIDPAKLTGGVSMGAEEALSFGLIPRMHRGIFAMNELPELDDLVLGQPGDLQPLGQSDPAVEGPDRNACPDALSCGPRSGDRDPQARGRRRPGRRASGRGPLFYVPDC